MAEPTAYYPNPNPWRFSKLRIEEFVKEFQLEKVFNKDQVPQMFRCELSDLLLEFETARRQAGMPLSKEQRQYFDQISKAAASLRNLIKPTKTTHRLGMKEVNVAELLQTLQNHSALTETDLTKVFEDCELIETAATAYQGIDAGESLKDRLERLASLCVDHDMISATEPKPKAKFRKLIKEIAEKMPNVIEFGEPEKSNVKLNGLLQKNGSVDRAIDLVIKAGQSE